MILTYKKTQQATTRLAAAQALLSKADDGVKIKSVDRFEVFSASLAETQSWPSEWTQNEITNCVRRAIIETVKADTLDWADFCQEVDKASEELRHSPFKSYAMWTKTNANIEGKFRPLTFKVGNVTLKITKLPPKSLRFDEIMAPGVGRVRSDSQAGGMTITAEGRFRSDQQAGEGLFHSVSDLCGLINLAAHRHLRSYRFGEVRPKATLLTGKYHFIFKDGVSTHNDGLWYNPDFRADFFSAASFSGRRILELTPYVRQVIKDLRRSACGSRISASIRILHESWQSHNLNQRILWAWTAFETLFSRSAKKADDYETIKNRVLFFARNAAVESAAFDLAITYRNRFVHENGSGGAAENVAEYLDAYFIFIIEWILLSAIRFESHGRFLDMIETPRESSRSLAQIVDRRRAIKTKQSG